MVDKLSSRKFLLALAGVVIAVVSQAFGKPIPWEAVSIIASYIAGEAGVDIVRQLRGNNK